MSIDWTHHSLTVRQVHGDKLPATRHIRHMLLAAITAGDAVSGARFTETELGKQLGFSRTPLREAIAALKAEGIVETSERGEISNLESELLTRILQQEGRILDQGTRMFCTYDHVAMLLQNMPVDDPD